MKIVISLVIFCLITFVQISCSQAQVNNNNTTQQTKTDDTKSNYPSLKIQAEELCTATVKGDFAKLADLTHAKLLEKLGGRDKLIAFLKRDSEGMKADGFELMSATVSDAIQIVKVEKELFAVLPLTLTIKAPKGKAIQESSVIGISDDDGANWKFINGINQQRFSLLFPNAASKVQIPAEKPPVFTKDN